ncbi:NUDIX domain-containing protein [Cochlodiniinecator piscidefendens]|uniref:NUDIX domain-containing protein n=1 Tax=Cochlodiniinecator piscidefendens TaxID=2715756 RepID=UPI00140DF270|nr:NUDIX domain-containing protein [Cochlodiniinecator piscidefendens]
MKALPCPRLAARALILKDNRLLLVNAWRDKSADLWCAPGGGVERGASLPENLIREVHEECGLTVTVGTPALINEFHDPMGSFHQVDIYFHCTIISGNLCDSWKDPAGVVSKRRFFSRSEIENIRVKPDSLATAAWGESDALLYDPLEPIQRS